MFWTYSNGVIFMALILSIDYVMPLQDCTIDVRPGLYYSRKASQSHGKIVKTFESENSAECRTECCSLKECNLMMYSTVLKLQEISSTNITCFLFNCTNSSQCITKRLPGNITGVSYIGIKQENVTDTNNTSSIQQHTLSSPSIHLSGQAHESAHNNSMINTNNTETNLLNSNQVLKTSQLPPTLTNSPFNSTTVLSKPETSIENISHSTLSIITPSQHISSHMHTPEISKSNESLSILSPPLNSIYNTSHSTLSTIIHSQTTFTMHTPEIPKSNESLSILSHPLKSIQNTSHSTVSKLIHSQTTLAMHTPRVQPSLNHSLLHHVGLSSGSHSTVGNGSMSTHNQTNTISHTSSYYPVSERAAIMVNSQKSNSSFDTLSSLPPSSSTFVHLHNTTEALLMLSLDAVSGALNVSNAQASKFSHTPTTLWHTSKSDQKSWRKFSEKESHTTPVSLVISLIFGIIFFGIVVFLIGRRWSEQCFRRGYSRVDYLLNDYD